MRSPARASRARTGLIGVVLTLLVVAVGQSITSVPMLFAAPVYYAQFRDTGGIDVGDKVQIGGVDVGSVHSIAIRGNRVEVGFVLAGKRIGTASRAIIRTDTILGRKNMRIEPRGSTWLRPGGVLPLDQTTTPYQVYDAFVDAAKTATEWDFSAIKQSLRVLGETFDHTAPHLSAALDGLTRFSETIGRRDEQISRLLTNAAKVATVFGDRSAQINDLLVNSTALLGAFRERSQLLSVLLANVSNAADQITGTLDDNPGLTTVLRDLNTVGDELVLRKNELAEVLVLLSRYTAALSEAVASGPYFKVMVVNLAQAQISQPWLDAAFRKRGIDPHEFWRNAGLPSFRYPDPGGTRLPNAAPPSGPQLLEGTPEHPGPAVAPGTPCSYAPAAGAFPTPENPLPCAALDPGHGPFGPAGPYPPLTDVLTSPPRPPRAGGPAEPGISSGGLPGQVPPPAPGTPVPLPDAPPGARREPPGPPGSAAGPAPANPGAAPPPSAAPPPPPEIPRPAPRPGPGQQLPAPFITPNRTGGST